MPYLDRDGVCIYYEVHGRGPVVLLSHGYAGTTNMWRYNVDALAAGCRVLVWDMRGHGRSDSPPDPSAYSEELTVRDIAALLDVVGTERAVIGGLSFGGYASLAFALDHPERVGGLMVFSTGPGFRSPEPRAHWNAMVDTLADGLAERGVEALWGGPEVDRDRHRSAEGLMLAARGMLPQHDARVLESLPDVRVPALVVVGEDDVRFRAAADYMEQKISGARKVVVPGAGHAVNIEQPEAFNRAVLGFLTEIGWTTSATT